LSIATYIISIRAHSISDIVLEYRISNQVSV